MSPRIDAIRTSDLANGQAECPNQNLPFGILPPAGQAPSFLAKDGGAVVMTTRCQSEGFASSGVGECRAAILPVR